MPTFIPALKYHFLTPFYDIIIKLVVPEKKIRKQILHTKALNGSEKVVDFGCGTGTFMQMLKEKHPNLNLMGIDIDDKIIKIANQKFEKKKLEMPISKDFADIPEDVDVIYSTWVFHHLSTSEKLEAFKEIHHKLKPEGTFILADWGKPHNLFMKIAFFVLQVLDNFTTTEDNKNGLIPSLISQAGFSQISTKKIIATPLGSLYIWQISK